MIDVKNWLILSKSFLLKISNQWIGIQNFFVHILVLFSKERFPLKYICLTWAYVGTMRPLKSAMD